MNELVKLPNDSFEITSTGLIVHGQPTFEQFGECWLAARQMSRHLSIIVADLLIYGFMTYGEPMAQLLDSEDDSPIFTYGTLRNLKYTFERFPPSRRRDINKIPVSFYQELAPLDEHEQERILDEIERSREANKVDYTRPKLGRDYIRQEKRRLAIDRMRDETEAEFQEKVNFIIRAIQALAEVYPPGVQQIRDFLNELSNNRLTIPPDCDKI